MPNVIHNCLSKSLMVLILDLRASSIQGSVTKSDYLFMIFVSSEAAEDQLKAMDVIPQNPEGTFRILF